MRSLMNRLLPIFTFDISALNDYLHPVLTYLLTYLPLTFVFLCTFYNVYLHN